MHKLIAIGLSFALLGCSPVEKKAQPAISDAERAALETEARLLVKRFAGQLKPTLKKAIQEDGFANAVQVCADQAPRIAASISTESGWQIKRVSLKPRNTPAAVADAWEREVLNNFEQQQLQDSAAVLQFSALSNTEFRFMQGQKVQGLCLGCHGSNLSPDVKAALAEHYPDDSATGYSLGQVRGAFSLRKSITSL